MAEERPAGVRTVQLDNEHVRVSEWRFAPGATTGWHRHEFPYVVVPLVRGTLSFEDANGVQSAELDPGASYFRPAGVEHDVRNASGGEFAFIEIELKSRAS